MAAVGNITHSAPGPDSVSRLTSVRRGPESRRTPPRRTHRRQMTLSACRERSADDEKKILMTAVTVPRRRPTPVSRRPTPSPSNIIISKYDAAAAAAASPSAAGRAPLADNHRKQYSPFALPSQTTCVRTTTSPRRQNRDAACSRRKTDRSQHTNRYYVLSLYQWNNKIKDEKLM